MVARLSVKVGDLVRPIAPDWQHWWGLVLKEIPGHAEVKVIMWNRDNNVVTSNPKRDLEILSESR